MIKFKKIDDRAIAPTLATDGSAGFDIYAASGVLLDENSCNWIHTDIACHIPEGYVGLIKARSGLASRYGMQILGGVIDSDYRGEIVVMATCLEQIDLAYGERIAQLVVVPCLRSHEVVESLDETERGSGGFGSTGK